ncbi:MAG TPA: ArsR family transcriptional regulator [Kiritimatiellae bacterium]|nr:ArsR family transcriptional regulator [Kiritimatiellia bacterium]
MHCSSDLSIQELVRMADILRLLAHPYRLKIVEALENGPQPVHKIVQRLGLSQASVSQHLNAMRRVGLLNAERQGREVWYRIADRRSITILQCIREKRHSADPQTPRGRRYREAARSSGRRKSV